jgi:hypothetical protein
MADLGVAAPWRLNPEGLDELLADNGRMVVRVDPRNGMSTDEAFKLATWVLVSVNTLAGFKVVTQCPEEAR